METVSVFILCYNQQQFLKQRIDSVLNQSYSDFEVTIWDDASTDESRTIIADYQNNPLVKEIIINKTNSGSAYIQWANAIKKATGEFLWIAEGDDYTDPDFLLDAVNFMKKYDSVCLVETNSRIVKNDKILLETSVIKKNSFWKKMWDNNFVINGNDYFTDVLCLGNGIVNVSAVLFRTEGLKNTKFDAAKYKFIGDWALYFELSKNNSFGYLNRPLSYFRMHTASVTKQARKDNSGIREMMDLNKDFRNRFEELQLLNSSKHRFFEFFTKYKIMTISWFNKDFDLFRKNSATIKFTDYLRFRPRSSYLHFASKSKCLFDFFQYLLVRKRKNKIRNIFREN